MSARVTRKRARTELEEISKEEPHEANNALDVGDSDSDPKPHLADDELGNGGLERDAEFWISDGTIILVAQNVEFRFYRALLTDHSPVFKAMFAGQHPTRVVPIDEQQSIGCPVIQLTDSPQDLRHILRAYVSGTHPGFLEAVEPSFDEISACIRLGRKYELKALYGHAREFLEHHYPSDFKTWTQAKYWGPEHWPANAAVGVVNLARLIDEPSLLPTALLTCIYMKEDIMQGFEREDGTRETLALDDIGRCFRASGGIRQATIAAVVRTLRDKACTACKTQDKCIGALRRALQGLDKVHWLMTYCPIRLAPDHLLEGQAKLGTCADCTSMVKRRSRRERAALWARLPEFMEVDVPGWAGDDADAPQGKTS
ncbi:hypothetical protein V8D89_009019 [Ganoderma adspersum]